MILPLSTPAVCISNSIVVVNIVNRRRAAAPNSKLGSVGANAGLCHYPSHRLYRAYDPDVKRSVAIKILTAEANPELLKRFQIEIGTTGNLAHKNIVAFRRRIKTDQFDAKIFFKKMHFCDVHHTRPLARDRIFYSVNKLSCIIPTKFNERSPQCQLPHICG